MKYLLNIDIQLITFNNTKWANNIKQNQHAEAWSYSIQNYYWEISGIKAIQGRGVEIALNKRNMPVRQPCNIYYFSLHMETSGIYNETLGKKCIQLMSNFRCLNQIFQHASKKFSALTLHTRNRKTESEGNIRKTLNHWIINQVLTTLPSTLPPCYSCYHSHLSQ